MLKRISSRNRSGVVLLIVIAMLALFAAVGLAFVYYADNEAAASHANVDQGRTYRADADPELLLAHFMSQLLYGTNDIYFDDVLVYSYSTSDGNAPHYLVLNVGYSASYPMYGVDGEMKVDWVRVWV